MASNSKTGVCHICGEVGDLSFEHVPPRSVGNVNTSKSYKIIDIVKQTGHFDLSNRQGIKYQQEQRGSGFRTICKECNNYLGRHYVREYRDFHIATATLFHSEPELKQAKGLHVETDKANALALFKHIVSNFCATAQAGAMLDCKDFLLNFSSNAFPNRFKVFAFAVPDADSSMVTTRWVAHFTGNDVENYYLAAYVAMFPLGFALLDSKRSTIIPENLGCEITPMAARKWGEKPHMTLDLPYMQLNNGIPAPRHETD